MFAMEHLAGPLVFLGTHFWKYYARSLKGFFSLKNDASLGVPAVAQQDWQPLGSAGRQVPSPAQPTRLGLQQYPSFSLGCSCGSNVIWSLAPELCMLQGGQKRKKKYIEMHNLVQLWKNLREDADKTDIWVWPRSTQPLLESLESRILWLCKGAQPVSQGPMKNYPVSAA